MEVTEAINKIDNNGKIILSEKILINKSFNINDVHGKIDKLHNNPIVSTIKEIRTLRIENFYITLIKVDIIENKIGDWIIIDEKEINIYN